TIKGIRMVFKLNIIPRGKQRCCGRNGTQHGDERADLTFARKRVRTLEITFTRKPPIAKKAPIGFEVRTRGEISQWRPIRRVKEAVHVIEYLGLKGLKINPWAKVCRTNASRGTSSPSSMAMCIGPDLQWLR